MHDLAFSQAQKRQHEDFEPDKTCSAEDESRKIQKALPQHTITGLQLLCLEKT